MTVNIVKNRVLPTGKEVSLHCGPLCFVLLSRFSPMNQSGSTRHNCPSIRRQVELLCDLPSAAISCRAGCAPSCPERASVKGRVGQKVWLLSPQ